MIDIKYHLQHFESQNQLKFHLFSSTLTAATGARAASPAAAKGKTQTPKNLGVSIALLLSVVHSPNNTEWRIFN